MTKQELEKVFSENFLKEAPSTYSFRYKYELHPGEYRRPRYVIRKKHNVDDYVVYVAYFYHFDAKDAPKNHVLTGDEILALKELGETMKGRD